MQAVPGEANWAFDLDAAAAAAREAKVLLLVNPHNPTGPDAGPGRTVWRSANWPSATTCSLSPTRSTPTLALSERAHIPFASLSEDLAARTVTLYSASKAYNLEQYDEVRA